MVQRVLYSCFHFNSRGQMLLVKTEVKNSPIAGVGLFAAEEINKGDIVWQYSPNTCLLFTNHQFQSLLNSFHKTERQLIEYYLTYGYYQEIVQSLVCCLDNGRYVNHSEQPTLSTPKDMPANMAWQYSIALRDIQKGEELTENYTTYDSCDWLDAICHSYQVYHFPKIDLF